jgi:RimJ/RimL family protein N-acetyltransferase
MRPTSLPTSFATPRLVAEALRPQHASAVHRMHVDAEQMEHLGGVRSEAQTAEYMTRNLAHWESHGFGLWLLRERSGSGNGDYVGRVLLRHLDLDGIDEVEVGYSLAPALWGKGLAVEVTRACLEMARERLRLETVVALTAPANRRSHRVLEKVGMAFERELLHEGSLLALFRVSGLQPEAVG